MRGIIVAALLILGGCSGYQTLEQLEDQALVSGDWSAVEKREELIARQARRNGPKCPRGFTAYCETSALVQRCSCVDPNQVRSLLVAY